LGILEKRVMIQSKPNYREMKNNILNSTEKFQNERVEK